jgi:hypothetical protein
MLTRSMAAPLGYVVAAVVDGAIVKVELMTNGLMTNG